MEIYLNENCYSPSSQPLTPLKLIEGLPSNQLLTSFVPKTIPFLMDFILI